MKCFFIVNPLAGKKQGLKYLNEQINLLPSDLKNNYELIIEETKGEKHATKIVKELCQRYVNEEIAIFACGGDGTCFEVLNGIVGFKNASMGIIPVGSCNDFLKAFPEYDFSSIELQLRGKSKLIDVIKVNDEYCLNVANFGYDARVNHDQVKYRSKFKTVKKAYNYALVTNLFSPKLGDKVKITSNDETIFEGKSLLFAVANANYYGGGYKCAPLARVDDGLMDLVAVKKISILRFLMLVKNYKLGNHLTLKKYQKVVTFKQLNQLEIETPVEIVGCLDGETRIGKKFKIDIMNKCLKFNFPKKNL